MGNSTKQNDYRKEIEKQFRLREALARLGYKRRMTSYFACRLYRDWKGIESPYDYTMSLKDLRRWHPMSQKDVKKRWGVRL